MENFQKSLSVFNNLIYNTSISSKVRAKEILKKKKINIKHLAPGMQEAVQSMGKDMKRPLGKFNPWAWGLEPVRGCNLKCWHCPAHLLEDKKYEYMSEVVWRSLWEIIAKLTPRCRVEMANTGEPTLHPKLLEFIEIARKISPLSQIQVTTNGTMLMKGKISYDDLFQAGANVIYVDMYAPKKKHVKLAKASGYDFYKYYEAPKDVPNAWVYHDDPSIQFIALSEIPDNWPSKKLKRGGLGTFLNNIDFKRARKFGIRPVENAPFRRCSQPMKYVQVAFNGDYMMCCQDALYESKVKGNVINGSKGFKKFWLGKYMQRTRQKLYLKKRSAHPICKRCNIIFSRCDMKFWNKDMFNYYWDGRVYRLMKTLV